MSVGTPNIVLLNGVQMSQRKLILTFFSDNDFKDYADKHYKDFREWCETKVIGDLPKSAYFRCIKNNVKYFVSRGRVPDIGGKISTRLATPERVLNEDKPWV